MKKETAVIAIILASLAGFFVGLAVKWPEAGIPAQAPALHPPLKGGENALVKISVISDFQCPFCRKAATEILPALEEKFKSRIAVEFWHNPLASHPFSLPAAKAAIAAQLQGKFWDMHDLLFQNTRNLNKDKLITFARQIGLDVSRFMWDMNDPRVKEFIAANKKSAHQVGITGTPTFIINGIIVRGIRPVDEFAKTIQQEIEQALSTAKQGIQGAELWKARAKENGASNKLIQYFYELSLPQIDAAEVEAKVVHSKSVRKLVDDTVWKVTIDPDDPVLGSSTAPLTIVVFSDFQCPHSKKAVTLLKRTLEQFRNDTRLVFKHFPLPFHRQAMLAAEASMAAKAQGKFWEMHDLLFNNQSSLNRNKIEKLAQQLGLDMPKFRNALDSHAFRNAVLADKQQATKLKVHGTPTIFINGRKLSGAHDFDTVYPILKQEYEKGITLQKQGITEPYQKIISAGKTAQLLEQKQNRFDNSNAPLLGSHSSNNELTFFLTPLTIPPVRSQLY